MVSRKILSSFIQILKIPFFVFSLKQDTIISLLRVQSPIHTISILKKSSRSIDLVNIALESYLL